MRKKLVEVTWVDIEVHAGWQTEIRNFTELKSYGLLIERNRERVVICSGFDLDNKNPADIICFPRGCVRKIRVIEEVDI